MTRRCDGEAAAPEEQCEPVATWRGPEEMAGIIFFMSDISTIGSVSTLLTLSNSWQIMKSMHATERVGMLYGFRMTFPRTAY